MDKASVLHFGLNNFDKNDQIDGQENKKLTYNFVTSKQLKRGHNFGVVYFTPNSLEEELLAQTKNQSKPKLNKYQKEREKLIKLEEDVVPPVYGRQHAAVSTTAVESTLRPKPLTFNKAIQTTDFIDRPRSPLTWHEPTGESKQTQVEDGDLFNFDEEVSPILNVLTTKTLDQARMEVLEEEEINQIKKNQRHYEELRNRELAEVQNHEDAETRRKEEINRRYNQQKEKMEICKTYQKKLMSRCFAKEYLSKLKVNTMTDLLSKGVFHKQMYREFHFNLIPSIKDRVEQSVNRNLSFVNKLSMIFTFENQNKIQQSHKDAISKEYKRREDEETRKRLEKERRREEKRKILEEEARIKREKEKEELKNEIINELLKSAEIIDEPVDVYDSDGMNQLNKKFSSLTGGYIGQWALIISKLNSTMEDFINSDKLLKIFEIFMPKFPAANILLPDGLFEEIQKMDNSVSTIDDLIKCEDKTWLFIMEKILELNLSNNITESFISINTHEEDKLPFIDYYKMAFETMIKAYRTIPEVEKYVKFIQKDPLFTDNIPLKGVFFLSHDEYLKGKIPENMLKKGKKPAKISYDPEILEKFPVSQSVNEKMRIITFNPTFDRIIRHNMIECINKVFKIDLIDKDAMKNSIEEEIMNNINILYEKISRDNKVDLFEYYINPQGDSVKQDVNTDAMQ